MAVLSKNAGELNQSAWNHFFMSSTDLLCIASFDGYFKHINRTWERVLGYTAEELSKEPFVSFIHPEDRAATVAATRTLTEGRDVIFFKNRYRCKDGSYRLLEWKATPAVEHGSIYAIARDITGRDDTENEQRALRERLAHLLHSSRVVLYSLRTSGDFGATFVSSNVTDQFGYEPREFLENPKFWEEHLHPDDAARSRVTIEKLLVPGHHTNEYRFLHKDGTYRWVNDDCTLLRDEDGKPVEVVGSWQDISENKQAELTIQQQSAALSRLSTPFIPISDDVIIMPLVGLIDSQRASQVIEMLLDGVSKSGARVAILDITGVGTVDTAVANVLLQAAGAVRLLGAQLVLTGMRPEVAQTVVTLGIDLKSIVSHGTLQAGILYATRQVRALG